MSSQIISVFHSKLPPVYVRPLLAHTVASRRRQLLHFVPAVRVIQEGHVLVVGGPAAGGVVPQLSGRRVKQNPAEQQVGEGEVVVGADAGTRPATVLEEDGLVRVVAEPEVSNLQQDGVEATLGVWSGAAGADDGVME